MNTWAEDFKPFSVPLPDIALSLVWSDEAAVLVVTYLATLQAATVTLSLGCLILPTTPQET